MANDPRKGLPSASNAEADSLCPGRHLMQQGMPEEKTEYASRGSAMHAAMCGEDVDLSDEDRETVDKAKQIEDAMLEWWLDGADKNKVVCKREKRYWGGLGWNTKPESSLCSGQVDAVWICGDRALIEDLKTLYADVQHSSRNMQLRDLAALVSMNEAVEEVTVYINQPNLVMHPQPTVYTVNDLQRAESLMLARAERSLDPNSPRIPGEKQCRWCRAKTVCPEAIQAVKEFGSDSVALRDPEVGKKEIDASVKTLEGFQLTQFLERWQTVKLIGNAIEEEAKQRLQANSDAVPGWCMKPGARRVEFDDNVKAQAEFADLIPAHEFWAACCQVSKSKIQNYLEVMKQMKNKDAKAEVARRAERVGVVKQNAPSLVRRPPPVIEG